MSAVALFTSPDTSLLLRTLSHMLCMNQSYRSRSRLEKGAVLWDGEKREDFVTQYKKGGLRLPEVIGKDGPVGDKVGPLS
jgi:hypothetical protein